MDEQKEKQNAKKKRSALPIYAIGIVWLLYAAQLNGLGAAGVSAAAVIALAAAGHQAQRHHSG